MKFVSVIKKFCLLAIIEIICLNLVIIPVQYAHAISDYSVCAPNDKACFTAITQEVTGVVDEEETDRSMTEQYLWTASLAVVILTFASSLNDDYACYSPTILKWVSVAHLAAEVLITFKYNKELDKLEQDFKTAENSSESMMSAFKATHKERRTVEKINDKKSNLYRLLAIGFGASLVFAITELVGGSSCMTSLPPVCLDSMVGTSWLNSEAGVKWLKTDKGQIWLQSPAGLEWLNSEASENFRNTPEGIAIMEQASVRVDSMASDSTLGPKGTLPRVITGLTGLPGGLPSTGILNNTQQAWLRTPNGQQFLSTTQGSEWLHHSDAGATWKKTTHGASAARRLPDSRESGLSDSEIEILKIKLTHSRLGNFDPNEEILNATELTAKEKSALKLIKDAKPENLTEKENELFQSHYGKLPNMKLQWQGCQTQYSTAMNRYFRTTPIPPGTHYSLIPYNKFQQQLGKISVQDANLIVRDFCVQFSTPPSNSGIENFFRSISIIIPYYHFQTVPQKLKWQNNWLPNIQKEQVPKLAPPNFDRIKKQKQGLDEKLSCAPKMTPVSTSNPLAVNSILPVSMNMSVDMSKLNLPYDLNGTDVSFADMKEVFAKFPSMFNMIWKEYQEVFPGSTIDMVIPKAHASIFGNSGGAFSKIISVVAVGGIGWAALSAVDDTGFMDGEIMTEVKKWGCFLHDPKWVAMAAGLLVFLCNSLADEFADKAKEAQEHASAIQHQIDVLRKSASEAGGIAGVPGLDDKILPSTGTTTPLTPTVVSDGYKVFDPNASEGCIDINGRSDMNCNCERTNTCHTSALPSNLGVNLGSAGPAFESAVASVGSAYNSMTGKGAYDDNTLTLGGKSVQTATRMKKIADKVLEKYNKNQKKEGLTTIPKMTPAIAKKVMSQVVTPKVLAASKKMGSGVSGGGLLGSGSSAANRAKTVEDTDKVTPAAKVAAGAPKAPGKSKRSKKRRKGLFSGFDFGLDNKKKSRGSGNKRAFRISDQQLTRGAGISKNKGKSIFKKVSEIYRDVGYPRILGL